MDQERDALTDATWALCLIQVDGVQVSGSSERETTIGNPQTDRDHELVLPNNFIFERRSFLW